MYLSFDNNEGSQNIANGDIHLAHNQMEDVSKAEINPKNSMNLSEKECEHAMSVGIQEENSISLFDKYKNEV